MNRRSFLKLSPAALAASAALPSRAAAEPRPVEKEFAFDEHYGLRLPWPGLREPVRFWVIGDTHFGFHDARDDAYASFYARMGQWPAPKEPFEKMLARAKKERPDALVLVGDILSFPTLANVEYVESALASCGIPWLYVAGNHDWHFEGDAGSDLEQRARWIEARLKPLYRGADPLMAATVVKGVKIVRIDNSAYHVLPEQVAFFRREAAEGLPVVLAMHIPFWQPGWGVTTCACPTWGAATDPYWKIERRERWAERLMPSTYAFREAVMSTPNLVGVFTGHYHQWQFVHSRGQNLFSVPANGHGQFLSVTVSP